MTIIRPQNQTLTLNWTTNQTLSKTGSWIR